MVVSWCGYLSLRTGIRPANSFQVCLPENHEAVFSPGLVCVTKAYAELPFRVPQELGKAERLLGDWCPEQYCQAKLGTEEAQLQAWSRELGVGRMTGGEGCSPHADTLPPAGFSPTRVSEQQCSTLHLKGCQSTGNPTLQPGGGGEGPLATGTSLGIFLPKAKSSNSGLRKYWVCLFFNFLCFKVDVLCIWGRKQWQFHKLSHTVSCMLRLPYHRAWNREASRFNARAKVFGFFREVWTILGTE